jgi:hypothetical protein
MKIAMIEMTFAVVPVKPVASACSGPSHGSDWLEEANDASVLTARAAELQIAKRPRAITGTKARNLVLFMILKLLACV